MNEWQLIETAPKDGTRIIAWAGRLIVVRWSERFAEIYGDTSSGWYDGEVDRRAFPSLWMPSPVLPQ